MKPRKRSNTKLKPKRPGKSAPSASGPARGRNVADAVAPKPVAPPPVSTLPLHKKLIFACLTVLLFFGLLELGLALLGIEPAYRSGDPLVGFSRQLPHFVESGQTTGESGPARIETAPGKLSVLNAQSFPMEKPENTRRVVCLGGSTTYGRPFWDETSFAGWLRVLLPEASGDDSAWEVINAGGISYASYRILAVMEELAEFQPDLYVVYLGHNEFLERRTYGDLLDQPELLVDLTASAYRLRTTALLRDALERARGTQKPIVLGEEVERIPLNAVGPGAYHRDESLKKEVAAHLRLSLNRMVDIAEAGDAKLLFVLPASNHRQAAPFKSEHIAGLSRDQLEQWDAAHGRARFLAGLGEHEEALAQLTRCLAIDSRHAETHYLHGRALFELGRFDEAKGAFAAAIEEDICPLRAIRATRDAIRDIADARGVAHIDFQQLLDANAAHGITGADFFHDHLHPTMEANRLLAEKIVATGGDLGWWNVATDWNSETAADIADRVTGGLDHARYAEELCKLAHAMAAFDQDEMAQESVRDALDLAPDSEAVMGHAVSLYREMGQLPRVADILADRVGRHPDDKRALTALAGVYAEMDRVGDAVDVHKKLLALDPENAGAREQLGIALSRAGDHAGAVEQLQAAARLRPGSAETRNNLGLVLAKSGQPERAIAEYEEVLKAMPSLTSAYLNYGLALEALGRNEEAAEKYRRLLWMKPDHRAAAERLQAMGQSLRQ